MLENNEPMVIEDVNLTEPGDNEVHVKWGATGVCHSDVSIWQGKLPLPPPAILGHEGAGVVVSAGKNDYGLETGDHVIGSFVPTCGECFYCRNDQAYVCAKALEIGMGRFAFSRQDGTTLLCGPGGLATFAEETVVHEAALVKIPNDFSLEQAALVGCGVTTGVGAALFAAEVKAGSTCVVIGCGGVGQAVIQGCRLAGADQIIAADLNEAKRNASKNFGSTHSVNPDDEDLGEYVKGLTDGRGADYAMEAFGSSETITMAFDAIRKGGTAVIAGIAPVGDHAAIDGVALVRQEKTLKGAYYGASQPTLDFYRMLDMRDAGQIDVEGLITRTYTLDQINEAYEELDRGAVGRGIIAFDV